MTEDQIAKILDLAEEWAIARSWELVNFQKFSNPSADLSPEELEKLNRSQIATLKAHNALRDYLSSQKDSTP